MQNLSSIHRLGEKFRGWIGSTWWTSNFENRKIIRKSTSAVDFGPSKSQNRFAHAKLRLHVSLEVTRRNGLSSWKIIFFLAAGMLSGNWGGHYVCEIFGKVDF